MLHCEQDWCYVVPFLVVFWEIPWQIRSITDCMSFTKSPRSGCWISRRWSWKWVLLCRWRAVWVCVFLYAFAMDVLKSPKEFCHRFVIETRERKCEVRCFSQQSFWQGFEVLRAVLAFTERAQPRPQWTGHARLLPVGNRHIICQNDVPVIGSSFLFSCKSSSGSFTREGKTTVSFSLKLAFWDSYQPRVSQERFFRVFWGMHLDVRGIPISINSVCGVAVGASGSRENVQGQTGCTACKGYCQEKQNVRHGYSTSLHLAFRNTLCRAVCRL